VTPYSQHVGSKQNEPPFKSGGSSGSLGAGVLLSVSLHAVLIGVIIFGLPIFWAPEPLPGAIGIELAQLSDITAAPKVQKEGKPNNKPPEPVQEVKKEEPKKETPPPPPNPPAAAAPPPAAEPDEEIAEAIPDPEAERKKEEEKKKQEQKKKEEERKKKEVEKKKKEEEIKKQKKKDDQALDTLLANVLDQKPAPEPEEQPKKKKAEAKPAEPSTGPQTENVSEIPLTASEEDGIRGQIERNWNLGSIAGAPDLGSMIIEVRINLQPDGTVTRAQVINTGSSPMFRQASEGAVRAVMISSPLKLPPGKTYTTMVIRFHPDQVVQ
jgi:outer membrane biosynthesis protein TonB